jgi:hypothetical protein
VNAVFRWQSVCDTADAVEMKLFLAKAADLKTSFAVPTAATADVTLRRVQKLKVAPGAPVVGTFGTATGEAKADAQGLATIPGLKITTGPPPPLAIRSAAGASRLATAARQSRGIQMARAERRALESGVPRRCVMVRVSYLLLFPGLAFAAPVPKDAGKNPLYFPTAVGTKWVYEDDGGGEESVEVSAVDKDGDNLVVTRRGFDGNETDYAKMIVTADGLRQERERTDGKVGWVLKTTLKSGESWEVPDGGKRTVTGPEEVKVGAGTFRALKVVWETENKTLTSWYAPGVGEVKRVIKTDAGERVTRSLKSFTEGKK